MEADVRPLLPILTAGAFAAAMAASSAIPAGAAAGPPAQAIARQAVAPTAQARAMRLPGGFRHLVVIYQENHSFDNLFGTWGPVHGERVNGLHRARLPHTLQVAQDGTTYDCLLQLDVNLTSPPLDDTCQDPAHGVAASRFVNRPFRIDSYIKATDETCPTPGGPFAPNGVVKGSEGALPGGCTRDLVHRFYQEQYQLNGGRQNRYTTGSDAVGLTMGYYATRRLPIWQYLHSEGAPRYVVADQFFQAAFGGSFLNHQWLIAARTPMDTSAGALGATHSVLDANGMVNDYPLYDPVGEFVDGQLTEECDEPTENHYRLACGDFAVNTIQPSSPPASTSTIKLPLIDDQRFPNIGDRLSEAGISWGWYAGGWDEAAAGTPGPLFQFHHQPFNYFADYAPGEPGRRHLRDEDTFFAEAQSGRLPRVSFVKPYGAENEHPGYASEPDGSDHLVNLLKAVTEGPDADSTLVVVTYDEFGGEWDHVSPPGQGRSGVHDAWGPGTRIPALVISRAFAHNGVDHRVYDTTSILATIERSYGLEPLSSRDASVNDLGHAVWVAGGRG
jgi:phospholipase C